MKKAFILCLAIFITSCTLPIKEKIDFDKEKKIRYQKVIDKLIIIRDAELSFLEIHGEFTDDKNELLKFIDNNKEDVFKVPYSDKEFDIQVGKIEKFTDIIAPVFEVRIDKNSVLKGLDYKLIMQECLEIGGNEIRGEYISVGSLVEVNHEGNWPYFYNGKIYSHEWRSPRGDEFKEFGKIIVQNNVRVCGEYKVVELDNGEFLIACTPDGINWKYFVIYKYAMSIFEPNDEMIKKIEAPR